MLPEFIIERSAELGLDIIAVTDHNSCENAAAMIRAAEGTSIDVWPGMEVQSREEAHLLCLFPGGADQLALPVGGFILVGAGLFHGGSRVNWPGSWRVRVTPRR